ncbi:alpha/beta fold hydrolase [Halalkalibacter sp. APA_J-10(15)]|uniref:alpha/beta fold hydrolase n=1 Tax=Halalkalibacter sp. APA_J-10(15) TaxID=2933805 RepID=UPI001FF20B1D|nr:alpha/beta hydrolase [Halalkalibacter sp. APA_J-10(15)]MCK0473257.1 alpha/beta hydrolase [Halalkalibacter sp. APA_J-10(15)]
MPTITSNNVTLYYENQGEGKPIIFTHGASWNHKQWHPQVKFFSNHYQTVVWDVRGHGQSSLPVGKVDSEDFSKDLITLLDHLNIEKAILCGLSMGGHISLQTAIRYPERVEALILIGTPFTNSFNWYEKLLVPINRFSTRLIPMKVAGRIQANMLSKFNPHNKNYIEEAFNMIEKNNWTRVWDAVTRMESGTDLVKVKCPTLLLQGDHDTMIMRQQKAMLEKITHSQLKIIKDAHHATNLDNPEEVNRVIQEFLSQ